jgi:RNA polymerase sigma-70 factor (ECF subfamily)
MEETNAITRLKAGDIAGLKMLVELYQVEAVQAAYLITRDRYVAEDIVQAAFLRSFEKIQGFDNSRPFRPWFLRIVINDSIKMATRQRRQVSLTDEEDADYQALKERLDATVREPEEAIQQKDLLEEIQAAINRLSPVQRAAIVMHYFLEMKTAEMADKMKIETGTIRWHLSVARERLRKLLITLK